MNDTIQTRAILHITDGLSGASAALGEHLEAGGVEEVRVGDVYRGLARMLGQVDSFSAAFICTDCTGDALFELVAIATRDCPQLPLYVYGEQLDPNLLDSLVSAGAAGEAGAEVITRLTNSASNHSHLTEHSGEVGTSDESDATPEPVDESPRFPWNQYHDVPARTPPRAVAASKDTNGKAHEPKPSTRHFGPRDEPLRLHAEQDDEASPARSHVPLLTEEELRMLIDGE